MMCDSIDMRVVMIGAVALIAALYQAPANGVAQQTAFMAQQRLSLVRCVPGADFAADIATRADVGDVTGSITAAAHTPANAPFCR